MFLGFGLVLIALVSLYLAPASAYIPAVPSNVTGDSGIAGSPNITDISKLDLQWFQNGLYSGTISYQLVGNGSDGLSQGALVHFSEDMAINDTSDISWTPWIALVACDANATDASMEVDIFTLAADRGAVSALLYSEWSEVCIINEDYANPANFDQIMDIFSTQSLSSARLIEDRMDRFINVSVYGNWNASLLNSSEHSVETTISDGTVLGPGYMIATLQAYNASASPAGMGSNQAASTSKSSSHSGSNTSLAMVVLYAITGVVSALFGVVIISGAIRAIRHPERYGPRTGGDLSGSVAQTRTQGLTRAFLDTIPIIKFGRSNDERPPTRQEVAPPKAKEMDSTFSEHDDLYRQGPPMELSDWSMIDSVINRRSEDRLNQPYSHPPHAGDMCMPVPSHEQASAPLQSTSSGPGPAYATTDDPEAEAEVLARAGSVGRRPRPPRTSQQQDNSPVVPDQIGRDTCPICIVDFEEGDDLRVLPCAGHHRFHQQCVDPWLLELSRSCPICRQDFSALEAMLSGPPAEGELEAPHPAFASSSMENRSSFAQRFSRYIRQARRRRPRTRSSAAAADADEQAPPIPVPGGLRDHMHV